jgi:site-specific DNA-cytosine methylase
LDEVRYNNYYQVLNAKDYGIPQNRERVFIISIRKDIDKGFSFPQPIPLGLKLKDLLEDEVDEKYYLSEKMVEKLVISNSDKLSPNEDQILAPNNFGHKVGDGMSTRKRTIKDVVPTLQANPGTTQQAFLKVKEIGYIKRSENGTKHQSNTVYDPNGLGRTLTACDYKDPLKVKEDSKSETDDLDDIDAFLNED